MERRIAETAMSRLPPGRRGLKLRRSDRYYDASGRLPPGRRGLKHPHRSGAGRSDGVAFPPEGVD